MDLYNWLSLALVCTFGALSPGPSLIVISSITTSYGRKSGIYASLGHGLAIFSYALLSATGLSLLITAYSNLFIFFQFCGALFLIYVAFRIFERELYFREQSPIELGDGKFNHKFWEGFLLAILNPKIVIFFVALFSQFLEAGQSILTHIAMASLAGLIDTLYYLCMVFFISTTNVKIFLANYSKLINLIFASILIVLALSLGINLIIRI